MRLIDSHCHLDFSIFDDDREALLSRCHAQQISDFIVPGVDADRWPTLIDLVDKTAGMHGALGLHPFFISKHRSEDLEKLESMLSCWNAIAVGEIGLDFFHGKRDAAQQVHLFEAQLQIAKKFGLPVILHVRKAHDQVLAILRRTRPKGGVVHAFSGSEQQAKQYISLGFHLGVGGSITYERATRLRATLAALPLTSMVLESDSPDMLPAGIDKGGRNTPLTLLPVITVLSHLHHCSFDEIAHQTTNNVVSLFQLPADG